MSGARVFTTLNLTTGYHQMKLNDELREITAFWSPRGLFQWLVLSMKIKTSGAVFQRLIDEVLGNLQPRVTVVYIDNITIFSQNIEQHLLDVEAVLSRLNDANLKVNVDKCSFIKDKVLVLGQIFSSSGIQLNIKK